MPPVSDNPEDLLKEYAALHQRRHGSTNASEKVQLGRELAVLEGSIRALLKKATVKEPMGNDVVNRVADQITALGFDFLANRLRNQHARHPLYVPFRDKEHMRLYLSSQMREADMQKIPEFASKKKFLGIFG